MLKIYPLLLFASVSVLSGQTPITLGNANMPGNGDTLRFTNVLFTSLQNYMQTGPNYKWDFSQVSSTTE